MVKLINVRNDKTYYSKLKNAIVMSSMWNSLQTKSEVGLNKSEKGYQEIAKAMAGNIARGLNADPNLAESLTMCCGCFFTAYGEAGKKAVMQYLNEKGLNMSEAELGKNYIEYELDNTVNIVSPKFDQYLSEVFEYSKTSNTTEVEIAKLCNRTVESIKKIEMNSHIGDVKQLYDLSKEVEEECIKTGSLKDSKKIRELLNSMPQKEIKISEDTKKYIYNTLDDFVNYEGEIEKGIYEYIGANEG